MGKPKGADPVGRQGKRPGKLLIRVTRFLHGLCPEIGVSPEQSFHFRIGGLAFFTFDRNITALHCLTALCEFGNLTLASSAQCTLSALGMGVPRPLNGRLPVRLVPRHAQGCRPAAQTPTETPPLPPVNHS